MGGRRKVQKPPLILYVEDDDATAYLVQTEITGLEIFRVCNGEHAIEFLNQSGIYSDAPRPALVLLDLNMPKKTGFDVLADIRATPSLATIPVAIFTTSGLSEYRVKALAFGADYYFIKPSRIEGYSELATKLAQIIRPQAETASE
jgi:chemotaxis family two-component system response regulator Rcp1